MKKLALIFASLICALVFSVPVGAGTLGSQDKSSRVGDPSALALDYRWHCNAPCVLSVYVSPDFPANMQTIIDQQFAAWSASPYIDFVRTTDGTTAVLSMRPGLDGFFTAVKHSGPWLTWARVTLDYKWFDWDGMPFVVCHELSHMLGFNDGAPQTSDPNTCPTADHFAMLAAAYG